MKLRTDEKITLAIAIPILAFCAWVMWRQGDIAFSKYDPKTIYTNIAKP